MLWTSQLTRSYSATGPKGVSAILRGEGLSYHMEQKKKLDELSAIHPRITFPIANLDPRLRSHFWRPSNYAGSVALVATGSL